MDTLDRISIALNFASLFSGALVVVVILVCMKVSFPSMDRVSIRFTLAISMVDALKALIFLIYINIREDGFVCSGISFLAHYLTLVYLFLNVSVALNLQAVFVHGFEMRLEPWLWGFSLLFPFLLLFFPLASGKFGLDGDDGYCELRDPHTTETVAYTFLCFLIWGVIACLFCTVSVSLIISKLYSKSTVLDNIIRVHDASTSETVRDNLALKKRISSLIFRISLYCIIPLITQSTYLILRASSFYINDFGTPLVFIATIGTDIPGILNFLALLIDPAFYRSLESILQAKGLRVPGFLDSRLPSEKSNEPRDLIMNIMTEVSEESNLASEFKRLSTENSSITIHRYILSEVHENDLNSLHSPSYRYIQEAKKFIKLI